MNNKIDQCRQLYIELDNAISKHYNTHKKQYPCANGCASCCSQFFEISEIEFMLIRKHLISLPNCKKEALAIKANTIFSLFKEYWPSIYNDYFTNETLHIHNEKYYQHPDRHLIHLPCVFLSEEGSCEIYDQRPIVCRTTGVGYQHLVNFGSVCNVIRLGILTPFWQADLRPFGNTIESIRWIEDSNNDLGVKRQYPMFAYMHLDLIWHS